jgi:hypothetical protein
MAIYRPPSSAITNFKSVGKGGDTGGFAGAAESLLAQQAEDRKKVKKKMKSQERRALALGLLGLGSTIYNNQAQKRTKEIMSRKELNLANAKDESNKLAAVSRLGENLVGPNGVKYKTLEELKKADPGLYKLSQSKYFGISEAQLKPLYGTEWDTWKDSSDARRIINAGADGALKYLLDDGNLTKFYDSVRNITPANREATLSDLADKYANITQAQYEKEIGSMYNDKIQEFQNQRNVFSPTNFKNLLNQMGANFETKGKPNLWKNVTEEDIVGPSINEIFNAVKIGENLIPEIDKVISQMPKKDYISLVTSDAGTAIIAEINAYKFNAKDVDVPMSGKATYAKERAIGAYDEEFVFKPDLDEILEEIPTGQLEDAVTDAAALSERLKDEYDFAKDFYLVNAQQKAIDNGFKAGTQEFISFVNDETERFANTMQDDVASRSRVAYASVLRVGAQKFDPFGPDYGQSNVRYNTARARTLISPTFKFDSSRGVYKTDLGYNMAGKEMKQKLYMTQLHSILQSRNLDEGERSQLADIFLTSVPHPFDNVKDRNDILSMYQENYQPMYNQRYGNPEMVDNINRGLLLGRLMERRTEDF